MHVIFFTTSHRYTIAVQKPFPRFYPLTEEPNNTHQIIMYIYSRWIYRYSVVHKGTRQWYSKSIHQAKVKNITKETMRLLVEEK